MGIKDKCEIFNCKENAMYFIQDYFKRWNWDTGLLEHTLCGKIHNFCEKHNRISIVYDISCSPPNHN